MPKATTFEQAKSFKETTPQDPLAIAGREPNLAALQAEFALSMEWGPSQQGNYDLAFGTRLNRWPGQTTDGLKWQKYQDGKSVVRPYDGRPDTRQYLADSVINSLVDIDMAALHGAQVKPSPTHANKLTADQSAEMRAAVRWMKEGPLLGDMIDGAEFLSQMKNTLGWCVVHTCWQRKHGLTRETLTMEQLQQVAAEAGEGSILRDLPELILTPGRATPNMDPETQQQVDEDATKAAVELLRTVYPYLKLGTAQRIVKELREDGKTEFLYRKVIENRPRIKILVPGIDVFLPEEVQDQRDARAWFVREYYSEADLRAMVSEGWDEKFIEAAVKTAGEVSLGDQNVAEKERDKNARRIEIMTSWVRQVDDDGVAGIYCTVFSNFVNDLYADHYLCDLAHGQYPFVLVRTEIISPRPDGSRGVPTVLRTQQWEMKRQRDAVHILSELQTNPPRLKIGLGWSKAQESFAPGSDVSNSIQGSTLAYLAPPGSNGELALKLCEMIKLEARDYYGLPSSKTDSHPSAWQARQLRVSKRWLLAWGQVLWQCLVLMYDTYTPDELEQIIGRKPQLTTDVLLHQLVNMMFDSRSLDPEWVEMILEMVGKIRMWNTGGTIDDGKLVGFALSYVDPTLKDEITSDQAGAANAVYKDVEHQLLGVMNGMPPQLSENDPTAGMKLKFAQQIISRNPELQMMMFPKLANNQPNPHFQQEKAKNLDTLMKNWQHNVQETQTSKMQGRLGVQAVNNAPVQRGPVARK